SSRVYPRADQDALAVQALLGRFGSVRIGNDYGRPIGLHTLV
ncbi:hypothetical protein LCGC14_1603330, partial [marine sediment metagenome]